MLFEALIDQFGFGNIGLFRATNITKRIPKYKNVKVKDVDLGDRVFYSGKYTGYSDDELEEIIDTDLFYSHDNTPLEASLMAWGTPVPGREDEIKLGKLLHFRQVDKDLNCLLEQQKDCSFQLPKDTTLFPIIRQIMSLDLVR